MCVKESCGNTHDLVNNVNIYEITPIIAEKIENIDNIWDSYIPTDQSETILKEAIEKTERRFV